MTETFGVNEDPPSAHELAALAWAACLRNHVADAATLASRASMIAASAPRRARQEVEIVCVAVAGDRARAHALAAEHLAEFPDDELVRRVKDATR